MPLRSVRLLAAAGLLAAAVPASVSVANAPNAAPPSATPPTAAAPSPPAAEDGFALVPATGDHLKIDRRTGDVSLCRERDGDWTCTLVADDRAALDAEIDRLKTENDRLKARLAELERAPATAPPAPDGAPHDDPWLSTEDRRELDRFLDFSAEAMRRFFGLVEDLKKDYETDRI